MARHCLVSIVYMWSVQLRNKQFKLLIIIVWKCFRWRSISNNCFEIYVRKWYLNWNGCFMLIMIWQVLILNKCFKSNASKMFGNDHFQIRIREYVSLVLSRLPACVLSRLPAFVLSRLPACVLSRLPACVLSRLPACVLSRLPACELAC